MSAEDEIQAGLMNAMERGVPIEKAVQTFINAGYSEQSVRSAARAINEGNVSLPHIEDPTPESAPSKKEEQVQPTPQPVVSKPIPVKIPEKTEKIEKVEKTEKTEKTVAKEEGVSKTKIVILIIVLVLLLGFLVASILFKEQLLSLIL